jgi:peptidoglycan/LPS O-acetylase OafA/YrhL
MALPPTWIAHTLRALVPSFIADAIQPDRKQAWKLHPTSYLDGLRGLASMVVFICHFTEENHAYFVPSYGLNPDRLPSSWLQLPFVRLIYSGRPMVHIFFVISGFVLSYKPIKAIHAANFERCFSLLSSSTFRRAFRLFGPCIVSTFIIMVLIQMGWLYQPLPTFSMQFWLWTNAVFHSITWPWAWDFDLRPGYDVHLWTIPIEFAHSMLLFLVILMLARVRLLIRQAGVFALMMYCLSCGKWAAFEFLGGMFLAEIHTLQSSAPKAWESSDSDLLGYVPHTNSLAAVAYNTLYTGVILAAIFVAGWPNYGAELTPGIRSLLATTPDPFAHMDELAPQKFWFALSAFFVVWACGELDGVRRVLETPLSQYCGRVSYAVYIVHGPVLAMFQDHVVGTVFSPAIGELGMPEFRPAMPPSGIKAIFGTESPFQRTMSWLVSLMILGPTVVWVADVFWRAVDIPMINLARRLETVCLDDSCHPERSMRGQGYATAA